MTHTHQGIESQFACYRDVVAQQRVLHTAQL